MDLIIYDKINTISPRTSSCLKIISVTRRSGLVSFYKGIIQDLDLKQGTQFLFAQDKKIKKNWYLILEPKSENFLSIKNKSAKVLGIVNKVIASSILNSFGNNKPSMKFILAKEPIKRDEGSLYQLIPIETETTKLTSKPKK